MKSGEKWILPYDSWLKFTGEKEILFYDDLLSNPAGMIQTIMKFADIKETDLKLNCFAVSFGKSLFRSFVGVKPKAFDCFRRQACNIKEYEKMLVGTGSG
jgi:hypothetical protein